MSIVATGLPSGSMKRRWVVQVRSVCSREGSLADNLLAWIYIVDSPGNIRLIL